jgi:hypothetical protein
MPHAAPTSTAPTNPAACLSAPPAAAKSRGNPNLHLAPAHPARGLDPRGDRTHPGCLCRSPAIHGELRCRMYGGRSSGPRTPESLPRRRPGDRNRVRDPRTTHGNDSANARANNRHRLTLRRISRVDIALDRYQAHPPPAPSANRPPQRAPTPGSTVPFKPFRTDLLNREPMAKSGSTTPFKPFRTDPLNREPAAKSAPTVPFKPFHTDPSNREPPAKPGSTTPFKPSRTNPPNREPPAKPGSTVPFKPSRTNPPNREPPAKPGSTVPFKPFRTDSLNREPTTKPGSTAPFKPFRTGLLNREPAAKPGSTTPRVAGSNASSAAATAQPARAHEPASRPGQSGEASKGQACTGGRRWRCPDLACFTRLPWVVTAPPLPPAHPACQNRTT